MKFFVIICLSLCSLTSFSQFEKGTRMAGANIGSVFYNSGTAEFSYPSPTTGYSTKQTGFGLSFQPSLGWFISSATAVGVTLNVNPSSNKTSYEDEANGNTYKKDENNSFNIGIGGFARNYFSNTGTFKPFGQVSLNFGISSYNTEGFVYGSDGAGSYRESYDGKSSGGFFANSALTLGMTKLLSPNVGLDLYAGYTFSYSKNTLKTTTKRDYGNNGSIDNTYISEPTTKFNNHGFMIGAGFQVFLSPKKK